MRYSQLPEKYQQDICEYIHGTPDQFSLSVIGRENLDSLTERELFDAILRWNWIFGYTEMILDAHKEIFKKEEK